MKRKLGPTSMNSFHKVWYTLVIKWKHSLSFYRIHGDTCESQIYVGGDVIYLNAERFNHKNHADKVNKLFSEMVDGYPGVPAPWPTQIYTYDFGCTFMGAQFLDGECKDSATNTDKSFLVLHCLNQLVAQDVALCMLMTSEHFHFYRSTKNGKHIKKTLANKLLSIGASWGTGHLWRRLA